MQTVPDTWHIINDQDIVAHGLKMFGWYKRNGQRAIVNGRGDLLVRPTFLELSLLQVRRLPRSCAAQQCHATNAAQVRAARVCCTA